MRKILLIDDSDLFRDFLSQKLAGYGFEVTQAANGFDGIMKMRTSLFDLIIMDFYLSRNSSLEVLDRKNKDPNARQTPVIMASAKIDRENLIQVTQYGVRKFFTKPIKIDALVSAIAEILKVNIEVDNTPCIIDAYFNDEIIFIEVARGLNRDKIELLKYRLQELTKLYKVAEPKVLVMMSGLDVGPNDSLQLASLLSNIADFSGARTRNIKILTATDFVRTFVKNRPAYQGIEVVNNLEEAMDHLLGTRAPDGSDENPGINLGSILANAAPAGDASGFNLRFDGEVKAASDDTLNLKDLGTTVCLAVVDDDFVLREIIKKAFADTGLRIDSYCDGAEFVNSGKMSDYDLVFLDLMMPNMDGFQVLSHLKSHDTDVPVIVLSALSKRETVLKAMGLGVLSYLIKPIQPESIRKKAVEVLRMNF